MTDDTLVAADAERVLEPASKRRRQYDGLILEPSKPDIVTERGRQFFQSVARLGC